MEEMWCVKASMRYRFQIIILSTRRLLLNANVHNNLDLFENIRIYSKIFEFIRKYSDLFGYSGIIMLWFWEKMWCVKPSMRYRFRIQIIILKLVVRF